MKTDTTFDHWDTTPVPVVNPAYTFKPDNYSNSEWGAYQSVSRMGNDLWENAGTIDVSLSAFLKGTVEEL